MMKKRLFTTLLVLMFILCPAIAKDKLKVIDKDFGVYIFKINTNNNK